MKIFFKKESFVLASSLLMTVVASAQQGIGTDTPNKSSVLELKSSKRGLLLPRVALVATNQQNPIKHNPANSLLVYNTNTTTGANKVTPGYYYWSQDDSSWMRIINQKDINTAISNIGDTKVSGAELSGTILKIKQNGVTIDVTVDLASLVKTYVGDNTSIKIDGTTVKRAALTGDVTAAEGNGNTKVTAIQGQGVSEVAPTESGQVLKWNGSEWAPAMDANTQSIETVTSGDAIVDVEVSGGSLNKDYTVKIKPAGDTETKILQSVNGTVQWADAPVTNLQTMVTKVKTTASGPLAGTSWGANAEDPDGVYLVVLTYGFVGVVNLPEPANFKNRSIALQNISGSSRSFGSNPPANIGSIGSNRAMQLVSDGTSWYVAGGL